MKKLTLFYLEHCPYCKNARRALDALYEENPAYRAVEIDWVEESRQSALADTYDYYNVPAVFAGREKLYEAKPTHSYETIRDNLAAALEAALAE